MKMDCQPAFYRRMQFNFFQLKAKLKFNQSPLNSAFFSHPLKFSISIFFFSLFRIISFYSSLVRSLFCCEWFWLCMCERARFLHANNELHTKVINLWLYFLFSVLYCYCCWLYSARSAPPECLWINKCLVYSLSHAFDDMIRYCWFGRSRH